MKFRPDNTLPFTPVVIIGAARSGTNALRDMLVRLPGFDTWPCDEINPIWRHGNLRHPDDELPAIAARNHVRNFIRRAFLRIWQAQGHPKFVVEKTCANCLRVPFVDAVLPEAKYIYIVRNGVNVVASARKRWRGELEMRSLPYFLAKARYTPITDLPFYAASVAMRRASIRLGLKEHMGVWGPRFARMDQYADESVEALCARQWRTSVDKADQALLGINADRVFSMSYEDLTTDPPAMLEQLTKFLEMELPSETLSTAASEIWRGKTVQPLAELHDKGKVMEIIDKPMHRHGYI